MKNKLVLDTNVLMKIGDERILSEIYNLVKQGTHVFVLLTCVEKELNKLALAGIEEAVIGLKRLEKLKRLASYERIDILQVYADDPIFRYCAQTKDLTTLISGERELKHRVYDLKNPNVQIFDLTKNGRILPFDPAYEPEIIGIKGNQQLTEKAKIRRSDILLFLKDFNLDQVGEVVMSLYRDVMSLSGVERESDVYKRIIRNIHEEIGNLDFLCCCRSLTDAENLLIDSLIELLPVI